MRISASVRWEEMWRMVSSGRFVSGSNGGGGSGRVVLLDVAIISVGDSFVVEVAAMAAGGDFNMEHGIAELDDDEDANLSLYLSWYVLVKRFRLAELMIL